MKLIKVIEINPNQTFRYFISFRTFMSLLLLCGGTDD